MPLIFPLDIYDYNRIRNAYWDAFNQIDQKYGAGESKKLIKEIMKVADRLGIPDPGWLANLINFETAKTFDSAITNSLGYTGLIQFGTGAAADLGTTTSELRALKPHEQMVWVEKYFNLKHKRRGSDYSNHTDVYMAVFYPPGIGNPEYRFPSNVIAANNGIDTPREYAKRANKRANLPYDTVTFPMYRKIRKSPAYRLGLLALVGTGIYFGVEVILEEEPQKQIAG